MKVLLLIGAFCLLVGCDLPSSTTRVPLATPGPYIARESAASPAASPLPSAGDPTTVEGDTLFTLRERPLAFPQLAATSKCPLTTSPGRSVYPDFGPAIGKGPVYAVGPVGRDGKLYYRDSINVNGWRPVKVLWTSEPNYLGPVLIRGHQLNGSDELRFGGSAPEPDLFLQAETAEEVKRRSISGWRNWPSYTYVRSEGCYAYQIDGSNFSYIIVVEVVDAKTPL